MFSLAEEMAVPLNGFSLDQDAAPSRIHVEVMLRFQITRRPSCGTEAQGISHFRGIGITRSHLALLLEALIFERRQGLAKFSMTTLA